MSNCDTYGISSISSLFEYLNAQIRALFDLCRHRPMLSKARAIPLGKLRGQVNSWYSKNRRGQRQQRKNRMIHASTRGRPVWELLRICITRVLLRIVPGAVALVRMAECDVISRRGWTNYSICRLELVEADLLMSCGRRIVLIDITIRRNCVNCTMRCLSSAPNFMQTLVCPYD